MTSHPAPSRDEILLLIAGLSALARRALDLVFVLDLLPAVSGDDPNPHLRRLADGVRELRRVGLFAHEDPLRCAHPSIPDAVRSTMTDDCADRARRTALDLAIDSGLTPDLLAPLADACHPNGDPLVVEILADAAQIALRQRDPEHALRWLRRAIGEPCTPADAVVLRGELALASALVGEPGAAILVRRAALELDPRAGAQLVRRASALLAGLGRAREATELVDDIARRWQASHPEATSILEIAWLTAARHDTSMRATVRRRIAETAPPATFDSSPSGRSLAGIQAYELSLAGTDRERAIALARHALDHRAGGSLVIDMATIWVAVLALQFAGDLDAALDALDRLEERGRERQREGDVVAAHHLRASVARQRGRLDVARASAQLALGAIDRGWRMSVPGAAGGRCRLALLEGDLDQAERALALPGELEGYRDHPSLVEYFDARGRLRSCQGRYVEALEDHFRVRDRHLDLGAINPATILWADGAARALVGMERRTEALDLLRGCREISPSAIRSGWVG